MVNEDPTTQQQRRDCPNVHMSMHGKSAVAWRRCRIVIPIYSHPHWHRRLGIALTWPSCGRSCMYIA
ncbi:predicted protein [Plenodomus lingam JN3]|uniref:Predicted protein n=1 Tax=Leptosphaeria maculans (strain JN3 / isolate v23.1.3 / race Av1-4-5-6-7-8) TaxID=985895 RepID=E4ZJF1_LEPMJ|nr:predicted protein [Plenodomus lingam JN3]CBX91582.1 predicted protein [Plenodomus lingam JN3]